MGIFSTIKNAIFGGEEEKAAAAPVATAATAAPAAAPAPVAPAAPVDVAALMESKNAGRNLNWRVSIVDLMALLDMDHSLASRKELATELGYTGELNGSAEMNVWLHKQVMKELAANGGKVPADLLD
jgi:pyruvate/2-oxoglutarate dehydrogenase complex dihydrolipoamide acyltransferase (E2) component